MTKFRTLVESALKDYVESVPEEVLDEDFKSGFKKALGTALVGGMLAAPSMFGPDKAKMIADLNLFIFKHFIFLSCKRIKIFCSAIFIFNYKVTI